MPVDAAGALSLRNNHNLSYSEIAAIQGVSKQAIHKTIKHLPDKSIVDAYKQDRADILAAQQVRLLNSVDDACISKARLSERMIAYAIMFDKERLERGQATSYNMVDIRALVQAIPVGSGVQQEIQEPPSGLEGVRGDRNGE